MRKFVVASAILYLIVLVWAISLMPQRATIDRSTGWTGSSQAPETVESVDTAGPAAGKLMPRDRIIAVDGDSAFSGFSTPSAKLTHYRPGAGYRLTVSRNGHVLWVDLAIPDRKDDSPVPFVIAYATGSLGFFICAMIMGWKRPDHGTAQWGWLACLLTAFFYIEFCFETFQGWSTPPIAWAAGLVHPWHIFAVYCFIASFGAVGVESRAWRVFRYVLALMCLSTWIVSLTEARSPIAGEVLHFLPTTMLALMRRIEWLRVLALPIGAIAVMVRNYRRNSSPAERRRIEILVGAIAASLGIVAASKTFAGFHGGRAGDLVLMLGDLAPLPIPLCFCYAVVAHQVLDIRLVLRRGLQYLLARHVLRVLVLLPLVAIVALALRHPDAPIRSMLNVTGLALAVSIALCLEFRETIQTFIDRWFLRERFDRERLIRILLGDIAVAESLKSMNALVKSRLRDIYKSEFVEVRGDRRSLLDPTDFTTLVIPCPNPNGSSDLCLALGPRLSDQPYDLIDRDLLGLVGSLYGLMHEMFLISGQASDVNRAVVEERTRIAQEIHDTAGQGFAGISFYLAAARRSMQTSPEQAGAFLEAAHSLAMTSAQETRESVRGIRSPDPLPRTTHLETRMQGIAERFSETRELSPVVILNLPAAICALASEDVSWHLARVAEEAVTNACKHAEASQINISLDIEHEHFHLTVKDNGIGFLPELASTEGFGLQGMRERMRYIHGKIEIFSRPGQGTVLRVMVPVEAVPNGGAYDSNPSS